MNQSHSAKTVTLLLGMVALSPACALAALIDGSQLHLSGDAQVGAVTLTWNCNQPGDPVCSSPPPGVGDFAVTSSTGSFAQYNGSFGLIADINNALEPLNTPFSKMNFMTFDLNSNITIELTFIPIGTNTVSTDCAGLTHCTAQNALLVTPANPLGLSAFNLDQNANGTAATFGVTGIVHEAGGGTAILNGIFSAEFAGLNPQQTLAAAIAGTNSTYSANLNLTLTTVPEPAAMLIAGAGLIFLAALGRRRPRI